MEGASSFDEGRAGFLLQCDGVFAYVGEPYVNECANAFTVYALGLPGADDDVLEGCAVGEDEHGVSFACLGLVFADRRWELGQ